MGKSKTFNVARSTIIGIANNLSLLLLNLFSRKLFLSYIGIEYLSVAEVIKNFFVVFSFTEFGLSNSVLYMLYKPTADNDNEKIQKIIWLYKRFNRLVGLIVAICGCAFVPFIHLFINTNVPKLQVFVVYTLNLVTSASTYLCTYRNILLAANQKDYVSSLVNTCVSFVRIIVQCLLIYCTHSYLVYLATGLLATVIQNVLTFYLVGRMYPFIKGLNFEKKDEDIRVIKGNLFSNMASMFSVKISSVVINNTDNIIVSWLDTLMVGICSNYTAISIQLKNLVTVFHHALLHSIGIAGVEKNNEEKFQLFKKVLLANTFIAGLLSVCLGTLWNDFIILWIGDQYLLDPIVFTSLLLNFSWGLLIAPIWMFRDANGLFIYVRKILLLNALFNIVISLILGHFLGVGGVYIGTIIADLLTNFWYDSNLIFKKIFGKKNGLSYQFHVIENMVVVQIMTFTFTYFTSNWNVSIFIWICKAFIISGLYMIWFFIRNIKSEIFNDTKGYALTLFVSKIKRSKL